jgi:hypothetical protein
MGAALAASVVLATGCGRAWPTVNAVADAEFLGGGGGVRSVDVLPLDVGVGAARDGREPPDLIWERFELLAEGELASELARRGYHVRAFIGRDGSIRGHGAPAMDPRALEATQASLAAYGAAQARADGVLLTPFLPARLGEATGADATLYVGGWAYSGHDPRRVNAGDVFKVVLVAAFIVVVVAVLVIASKGKGGGGGAAGGVARGAAHVGKGTARAVAHVGRASWHVLRGFANGVDAWGRAHTHITVYSAPPAGPPPLPETGPSRTQLEMTLVDNRRGVVLWHARQEFAANPARHDHVKKVVRQMLAGLPGRR